MITGSYNNFNNQANNVSYGAVKNYVPEQINQKLPENIQNLDAQQVAQNNAGLSAAQGANKQSALLTLPIYASFVALRSANDATKGPIKFAGEYEKTILGKLAKAGDAISNGFCKIVPKGARDGASKAFKTAKQWVVDHSAIARSTTTPIRYENRMAIQEANGLFGRVMGDNADMFEKGFRGDVKALFKDSNSSFWKHLQSLGIDNADAKQAKEIVSNALRDIGSQPLSDNKTRTFAKDIINTLSKSSESIVIDRWGSGKLSLPIGKVPILGKAMTLKVPMSEIANKLRVAGNISGSDLAKTGTAGAIGVSALGRALPGGFAKIYEGLTSDFVGGKIAPALQAFFLAQAAIKAKDAPDGQKLATFMDEEASAASMLITMPIATSILAKMGGLKYIGMGTKGHQAENVKKYRDMIAALNEKVDAKTITRGEYVNEVKKIKDVLKGKCENGQGVRFWQRPFKAIGKLIGSNFEKETIKPFIEDVSPDIKGLKALGLNTSNKVKSFLYKFKSGTGLFKNFTPGGALRLALAMFVLSPIATKPIQFVINKIFGKPYDPDKANNKDNTPQNNSTQNNPFANMTEEELGQLLMQNQDTLAEIEKNPQLMQELQTNPQKLYDILKNGAEKKQASNSPTASPMLQNYINNTNNMQNMPANSPNGTNLPNGQANFNQLNNTSSFNNTGLNQQKMPAPSVQSQSAAPDTAQTQTNGPVRTYIPSSKPADEVLQAQARYDAHVNSLFADMDKTEQEYSRYIGI